MKTENGHILTFSDKMQICAVSCFVTCDWFCPMTSHLNLENLMQTFGNLVLQNYSTKFLDITYK